MNTLFAPCMPARRRARTLGSPSWRLGLALALAGAVAGSARADIVSDWNLQAQDTLRVANVAGAPLTRTLAIVHVAMADAVNTVQNRHARHALRSALQPDASAEAAAASAARSALVSLFPAQRAKIDEAYANSTRGIPDGPAKEAGAAIGVEAAAAVVADRAADNSSAPDTYRPITAPGSWIPTTPPLTAQYARAKPWGFERPDQFRPGPPPRLSSAEYARDYNETKAMGAVQSTQRTREQSDAVKFWSQANLVAAWYQVGQQVAAARQLDLADSARLQALLCMVMANTFIVDWDAKFHYNYWRPITAIRNGDNDGNDATERDAGWTPLNATPMHPEYPSQAAIVAGAASALLVQAVGGPIGAVTIVDTADPKITRQLPDAGALVEEMRAVRIWGGIHFRSSLDASDQMGRALAAHLLATSYRPVR